MTQRIRLSGEAKTELAEAIRWYEQRRPGLGDELLATVHHALLLIAVRPAIGRSVPGLQSSDAKRVLQPRFPYQLVYRADYH